MLKEPNTMPLVPSEDADPDFELLQLQSQMENGENPNKTGSLRTMGRILMQKRRYADAVPVYEALISADPGNVQSQEALARCLERMGRWGEALARYQLVLNADPDRPDALVGSGLCMIRQDNPLTALTVFDRCLSLNPAHAGALLGKATCLRLTGRDAEADQVYGEVARVCPELALDPAMPGANMPAPRAETTASAEIAELEKTVAAALVADEYVVAAEHCRALTELIPDYFEAWFNLGAFEQRNLNWAQAADAFLHAAALQPANPEPVRGLAESYHQQGDLRAAEANYRKALLLSPGSPGAMWNLAVVLELLEDFAGASEQYSDLVKIDQDRGESWFRLGLMRLRLGDSKAALVAFVRALDLGTRKFDSTYNLGLAYWDLGRTAPAAKCFSEALKLQPGFLPAKRGLAAAALREGDLSLARDLHRNLVEQGDNSAEVLFNLAVLEHDANRFHSAIEHYKQALKIDPHLGEATAALKLAEEALAARRDKYDIRLQQHQSFD
jgi:tetratricopeptide (TPR) repeat protein